MLLKKNNCKSLRGVACTRDSCEFDSALTDKNKLFSIIYEEVKALR